MLRVHNRNDLTYDDLIYSPPERTIETVIRCSREFITATFFFFQTWRFSNSSGQQRGKLVRKSIDICIRLPYKAEGHTLENTSSYFHRSREPLTEETSRLFSLFVASSPFVRGNRDNEVERRSLNKSS